MAGIRRSRHRDVVVGHEHHLEPPAHRRLARRSSRARLLMNLITSLAKRVGRRRLAGEEERPRRHVERRVLAQPVVEHDDVQRVQQLPLVLVDPLDLRVEDRVGVDRSRQSRAVSQPAKRALASRFAVRTAARNAASSASGSSLSSCSRSAIQPSPIAPVMTAASGGIGQQQEAPLRHAVGLVVEPLREELGEVRDDGALQQRRSESRRRRWCCASRRWRGAPCAPAAARLPRSGSRAPPAPRRPG